MRVVLHELAAALYPCARRRVGPWWPRTGPAHGRPWARCRSCTRRCCVTSRTPHVRSCSRPDPGPAPACGSLSSCHCPAGRGHCHPTHTPDNACSQLMRLTTPFLRHNTIPYCICMCSVAEWLACWTQAQKARVQIAVATLSGTVLGKLFTPTVLLFTNQQNW